MRLLGWNCSGCNQDFLAGEVVLGVAVKSTDGKPYLLHRFHRVCAFMLYKQLKEEFTPRYITTKGN
jgi:hypothetical protein